MRAVVQRVSSAAVVVGENMVGEIGEGLLVYIGVQSDDSEADARYIADKIRYVRIFPDDSKMMNRDVLQVGGAVLVVSAFTTAADVRRGRRPSFDRAADAELADPLYEKVCAFFEEHGLEVQKGRFGAMMKVVSTNSGPVCILLDSKRAF